MGLEDLFKGFVGHHGGYHDHHDSQHHGHDGQKYGNLEHGSII